MILVDLEAEKRNTHVKNVASDPAGRDTKKENLR